MRLAPALLVLFIAGCHTSNHSTVGTPRDSTVTDPGADERPETTDPLPETTDPPIDPIEEDPVEEEPAPACEEPAPGFTLVDLNPGSPHFEAERSVSDATPGKVLLIYFANYA